MLLIKKACTLDLLIINADITTADLVFEVKKFKLLHTAFGKKEELISLTFL